jgi:hypothetical protein
MEYSGNYKIPEIPFYFSGMNIVPEKACQARTSIDTILSIATGTVFPGTFRDG